MIKDKNRPILVTGSHRSGTTWASTVISSHPRVRLLNELFFNLALSAYKQTDTFHLKQWFLYITPQTGQDYIGKIKPLLSYRYHLNRVLRSTLRTVSPLPDILKHPGKIPKVLGHSRMMLAKTRPLMKEPIGLFSAEWMASQFDMDVVVLIRHPASFAASLKELNWQFDFNNFLAQPLLMKNILSPFEEPIREYARSRKNIIDQAALLWKTIYHTVSLYKTHHPDWTFIRLEDISQDPLARFGGIFDKLGIDLAPNVRQLIEATSNDKNPWIIPQTGPKRFTVRRHSKRSIHAWKHKLTEEEAERVRASVEDVSKEFYTEADWNIEDLSGEDPG